MPACFLSWSLVGFFDHEPIDEASRLPQLSRASSSTSQDYSSAFVILSSPDDSWPYSDVAPPVRREAQPDPPAERSPESCTVHFSNH